MSIWQYVEYSEEPNATEICSDVVRIRENIHSEERTENEESRVVWVANERCVPRIEFERTEWISRSEVTTSQLDQDEALAEIAELILGGV